VASTQDGVEAAVEAALKMFFAKHETAARSIIADAWQGDEARRRNALTKILASLGISYSSKTVSALLPDNYLDSLVTLERNQFEDKYGVPHLA
jgi:hypothetical protein